jgi:plasmid stabilization system protein ParE
MKVTFTDEALRDLDEILTFIATNYPTVSEPLLRRLRTIERRIAMWPNSAEEVEQRHGVRVVPFIRYPYKVFYQVTHAGVEILHIHHASRQEPWKA